ncbi:MAG: hypothetical protein U5Q44_09980 [Dehalococcoidia bacterium]|nr:hypothetical protein [Dehalococcoidia bacterium]
MHACRAAGADAAIKWPNDIWVGDRKVCGMLLDSSLSSTDVTLLAGIGINADGDPRDRPAAQRTSPPACVVR